MLTFVIDSLAVFRLTRLVTEDSLPPVARARSEVMRSGPDWAAELIECPWCAGFWIAGGVVLARKYVPGWGALATVLAHSALAGLIAEETAR